MDILQEALVKLIDFRIFLFSLSFLLKVAKFGQFLMSSVRKFQVNAVRCWKKDLPTSVLCLRTSTFKDFLKLQVVTGLTIKSLRGATLFP